MIVLNFAHPLTTEHLDQIAALINRKIQQVITVDAQVDPHQPLVPQVVEMVDRLGFSPQEWQTLPLLILLPSLNYSAGVLLAELHGRIGHFPAIVRMRPASTAVLPRYEVAEIIHLQAVRDAARARRGSG
ncbi:MAG: hypothetical protein C4313_11150 [Thermoflexus sp.]|uniref:CRISPR-associated protein Csx15 n=1 Tax=Thermoflexus sp. TaxID=1969742 RepID=UPI00331F3BB3